MQVLFHKHVWLYSEYMPTLHWWTGASSVSPQVMTVTWLIASGIILHHRSIAYELSIYCSSLIYFPLLLLSSLQNTKNIAFTTVTFCYRYHYYHITLLLNTLLQILIGVVELTTQLLILKNIPWLPVVVSNMLKGCGLPRCLLSYVFCMGHW